MSAVEAVISTLDIQTTRKRNPLLSAFTGGVLGAMGWAVTAVFMVIAWPYQGSSLTAEENAFYLTLFLVFGFVSGAMLGVCIGWVASIAGRALEPRIGTAYVPALIGALIGACAGALAVVGTLIWEQRNAGEMLYNLLRHGGFLKRPLSIQLITGILPGVVCGIVGARPQTTTTATCAACGEFVRSDATRCKHCGVVFTSVPRASDWKKNLRSIAIVGGLLLGLFGFAVWLRAQAAVPVPEIDSYVLEVGKVKGEHTKAELRAVLGEPPLIYHEFLGDHAEWIYPVRIDGWSAERATPAPMLEITLDQAGLVRDWGFFDPLTHERLLIRESLAHAHQWFDERDVSQDRRIDLATVLKTGSTKQAALAILAGHSGNMTWGYTDGYENHLPELEGIFVRPATTGEGEVLRFYVDHPSPLLIRPLLYVRTFDESGNSQFGYFSGGL